jgi:hypothetical protein
MTSSSEGLYYNTKLLCFPIRGDELIQNQD